MMSINNYIYITNEPTNEATIVRVITQIRTTSIPGIFRFFGHPILVILWAITLRRLGRHRQTVRWVAQSEIAETKEF